MNMYRIVYIDDSYEDFEAESMDDASDIADDIISDADPMDIGLFEDLIDLKQTTEEYYDNANN